MFLIRGLPQSSLLGKRDTTSILINHKRFAFTLHSVQLSDLYIGDNLRLKAGAGGGGFRKKGWRLGWKQQRGKGLEVGECGKWNCHHLRGQSAQETDTFLSESEGERDVPWGDWGHGRFWWCQIVTSRGHRTWGEGNKGWKRGIGVWEIKGFLHVGPLMIWIMLQA